MIIVNGIVKLINKFKEAVLILFKKKKRKERTLPDLNVILPITNSKGKYIFYCPGCKVNHLISTTPKSGTYHTLTGTLAKPTVRASVLALGVYRCHAYITEGVIEYLNDCTHHLAGKNVTMEPI